MAKYEQTEVDPKVRELSRRRFLRNAGITAAAVPFLGTFGEILKSKQRGREHRRSVPITPGPTTRPTGLPWYVT